MTELDRLPLAADAKPLVGWDLSCDALQRPHRRMQAGEALTMRQKLFWVSAVRRPEPAAAG
jgi:hypothetical protein